MYLDFPRRNPCLRLVFTALGMAAAGLALTPGTAQAADPVAAAKRPNVVVILADDLGYSDLGCYGGEIETPNLDRLAAGGLRFSQFYNCALCGPSRAAIMTGLHPHQVGISSWTGLLNDRCVTLFELLKRGGYATCAVGRLDMTTADVWHDPQNIHKYVDRFLGSTGHKGPGNYFKAVHNTEFFRDGEPYTLPDPSYKTDLITDFATEFIAEAATQEKPFFLYVAHYAPHWPLHAKPDDMAKYVERYRRLGWDAAREMRHRRLIDAGLIDSQAVLAPRDPRAGPWDEAPHKDWEAERMAAFAGQVDSLDQSVGRITDALRKANVERNTLVLFLSDNGASDKSVANLDKPGQTWRTDGTRTKFGNTPDNKPGGPDGFLTAGIAWSCLSNTPFRDHKNSNYEGGISTPCIAHWPGVVQSPGTISRELGHIVDIPATVLDVAGVEYPSSYPGRDLQPAAGKSLLPVLCGEQREGHESLCWSTGGCRAVRVGHWKLVAGPKGPWELFDLSVDRAEQHDQAAAQPDRVTAMEKIFNDWRK
jgi:arylsulfatase